MAQVVVNTPIQSPNKSPYQAFLPTALRGRIIPASFQITGLAVVRTLGGFKDALISQYELGGVTIIGQDYTAPNGDIFIYVPKSTLEAVTSDWRLYETCNDGFSSPTLSYNGTSFFAGLGACPQTSGYPADNNLFFPTPMPGAVGDPLSWTNQGAGWKFGQNSVYNTPWVGNRSVSGSVDVVGKYNDAAALLHRTIIDANGGIGWHYDVAGIQGPSTDVSGFDPSQFSGTAVPGGSDGGFVALTGAATCGWSIFPDFQPTGSTFALLKQKAKQVGGIPNRPFWVGRWQQGNPGDFWSPDRTTGIRDRVTFIYSGFLQPGQTIGPQEDNCDWVIPFPDPPFPVQAMGTNGMVADRYFATTEPPLSFCKNRGVVFGDNHNIT